MTFHADRVLSSLNYDPVAKTISLSAAARSLDDVRTALMAAFGEVDGLVLSKVELRDAPADTADGWEAVCFEGESRVFNYARPVYVELGVYNGEVDTVLILIPLSRDAWKLSTGFTALRSMPTVGGLRLRRAWAAVSYAIGGIDGERTVGDRTLRMRGFDLQDGLQFLSDGLVDATGTLTPSIWNEATASGLPTELAPDRSTDPDRVEVRANIDEKWLQVEVWWDVQDSPGDFGDSSLCAAGLGLHYELDDTPTHHVRWLWEVGTPGAPVVLEAAVWPSLPLRYQARMGAPAPLGKTVDALSAIIGPGHTDLLPDAPDDIDLISMTWAPGARFEMVTAAGNRSAGSDDHLVTVGPIELREVRYTIAGGLKRGDRSFSVGLEARAAFFGVDFGVNYSPGEYLEGGLADPGGVDLGALLAEAVPVPLPFGLDTLNLRHAWVRRTLTTTASTELTVRLDGHVALLPDQALTLDSVRFRAKHTDGGDTDVGMGATFTLGPLVLRVEAAYASRSWTLEGMGNFPDGLSLTDLVDHLVDAFGASVPAEVPDVMIETVAVTFETASKSFEIQAVVPFTVDDDVPVLAGSHTVMLTLQVTRDAERGGRQATLSLNWTLAKGANRLAASVYIARQSQRFSVELSAPDEPLKLTDLVHELGLPSTVPVPGGEVLDFIFQVSNLSISYARPGNQLDLAWTRPALGGTFLAEYAHSSDSDRVKVCWLATEADATIGLEPLLDHLGHGEALSVTRSVFGAVGLSGLVDDVVTLLTFKQLGFEWSHSSKADQLLLQARSTHAAVDRTFVVLTKGEQPGLVAGLTFREGSGLSDLPFLPDLVADLLELTEDVLHLHPTHFLVSTRAQGRFRPPGFSEGALVPTFAQGGVQPRTSPFGGAAMPLGKGVAIGMRLSLGDAEDNPLRKVLDFDHLDAQLTLSMGEVGVQAMLPGELKIDVGGGNSLVVGNPFLRVEAGTSGLGFDIGGSIDLMLFHKHLHAEGWLSLSTHSMDAHIGLYGFELPPSPQLPGVHFIATEEHPLWLDVGIQFAPAGLMMGMKGHFYIQLVDRKVEGDVTFVLEIIEIIPQPLYIEFELDEMSIPVMLEAMTGAQWAIVQAEHLAHEATRLPADLGDAAATAEEGIQAVEGAISHVNAIFSEVSLDDVRIRWCDSIVNLPDGSVAMPGVGFRGRISLFGWDAFAMLDFSSGGIPALTGHFEAEKISLGGVIEIWGDGKGVRTAPKSASDFDHPVADNDVGEWFIEPGGPVLHVSTSSSPFLHADLHARLFGFVAADVHADVTDEGFSFDLHTSVGPLTWDLGCHYWKDDGAFEASGSMGLRLHGDIGPIIPGIDATKIHLDTDLAASVELRVDSEGVELTLHGEFNFQGARIDLPEVTLSVAFSSIEELAEAIWDKIVELAEDLFEDVLMPVVQFFEDAAEAVAEVAVEAAEAVAEVAVEAAEAVAEITTKAVDAVEHAAEEVAEAAEAVVRAAAEVVSKAAERAHAAAAPLHDRADALRHQKGTTLEVAANQVAAIALDAVAYAEEAVLIVADLANQAAQWVGERLDEARRWVVARLADAARAVARFAAEAAAFVADIEREVEKLLGEIAELGRKIAKFFEDAAEAVEDFFVEDVGGAFESAFSGW